MTSPDYERRLPDWLVDVPMQADKPVLVPVGEGKSVSLRLIVNAIQAEVGTTIGSISIAPELRDLFTDWTENPAWRNLPTEPTSVERTGEQTWEVRVGDFSRTFSGDELAQHLQENLQHPSE
mgnify:CR=1 FL=1